MNLDAIERPLVLYHGPGCRDGWCAAYLTKLRWPDAELVPQNYGDPVEFFTTEVGLREGGETFRRDFLGRDVLILDFSYPREILERMHGMVRSLLVLDHHKTAAADLAGLDYAVFDEARSGCGLALDYFYPKARPQRLAARGEHPAFFLSDTGIHPDVVDVVLRCEAWDLWAHDRYSDVKTTCAYLDTIPRTTEVWNDLPHPLTMHERGAAVLAYQRGQVERIVEHAHLVSWPFGNGVVLNAVNSPVLQSEVGQALYEKDPSKASLVWYRNERWEIVCSLRSAKSGPDVSEMARKFGGGGHAHASGFKLQPSEHENAAWLWHAADRAEAGA